MRRILFALFVSECLTTLLAATTIMAVFISVGYILMILLRFVPSEPGNAHSMLNSELLTAPLISGAIAVIAWQAHICTEAWGQRIYNKLSEEKLRQS